MATGKAHTSPEIGRPVRFRTAAHLRLMWAADRLRRARDVGRFTAPGTPDRAAWHDARTGVDDARAARSIAAGAPIDRVDRNGYTTYFSERDRRELSLFDLKAAS